MEKTNYKKPSNLVTGRLGHKLTFQDGDPDKPCLDGKLLKGLTKIDYTRTDDEFGILKVELLVETDEWSD